MTMLMLSVVRALAFLVPLAAKLSTWLLAHSLNMPEPLVHATGLFVFVRVQAFETDVGRSLRPARLARRLRAWLG
jgi:hypothetical protein